MLDLEDENSVKNLIVVWAKSGFTF